MRKWSIRVAAAILALAFVTGAVVAVHPAPAQATTCNVFYAPSIGRGTVEGPTGVFSYKAWTAWYSVPGPPTSYCNDVQERNFLFSWCTVPADGFTYIRARFARADGTTWVTSLKQIYCGSSTWVINLTNVANGSTFRLEADYDYAGDLWQYNVQIMD